ncbi:hypothetical protein [Arthrobacter glacialis]|uniref:Uncharacterized protein n=1 Tax=Arthrobacter glacialis TaxID=1664 RepID=A0A2S3ZSP2_ARTGL|nr:hypothetical protein [Arthrobacter glacialis]POH72230.1 hypothetical protein CVS27_17240 [Arthrobacter glacialis]
MASAFVSNLSVWQLRRWVVAAVVAALAFVVVAIPTDLIPNPFFDRVIPPTWWSHAALIISSALTGFLVATYVASPLAGTGTTNKSGVAASVLAFFAVGCPVCNKLVLLALGTSGAMTFFEPLQPLLAILSLGLLLWALLRRVSQENACRVSVPAV